jgi:anti-anti-sigma factor
MAMEGEVSVKQEQKNGVLILRIKGRLDAVSSPVTEKQIMDIINSGNRKLLLDFSGVEYLSSAGMRLLLATTKKLKTMSGKLVVSQVTDNAMDVLKMSGFDHVIDIASTEDEALKRF